MPDNIIPIHRPVKTLALRAAELEAEEKALLARIQHHQRELHDIVQQRCAMVYEQRKGFGPTLQKKKPAVIDWALLLKRDSSERKSIKRARAKALNELHLMRGWAAWGKFPQLVVAFELQKQNPTEMYWVRDGLMEILPHIKPAVAGYKVFGISDTGVYSIHHYLLCAETNDCFKVVPFESVTGAPPLFEGKTLMSALEYIQENLSR